MNTKFTLSLAALMLVGGLAVAQPADEPATTAVTTATVTTTTTPAKRGGEEGRRMRPQGQGPFARLHIARRIEDLTDEQKTKIDQFLEKEKANGEALQGEFREAMQKARESTDREARRAAMKDVQEKFRAADEKVDAFLKETLTDVQQTRLKEQAGALRKRAGQRVRKMRDAKTTATASEGRGWEKSTRERPMKDHKPGKAKGDKPGGKKGKKMHKQDGAASPASADQTTTVTVTNSTE